MNLGTGLALQGSGVLLVDFNPQANLTQYVQLQDRAQTYVGDWIAGRAEASDVVQPTPFPNLSIARSDESLKAEEIKMQADGIKGIKYLEKQINQVQDRFDFILVDTLLSFSHLFMASLVASDQVLILAKLEFLSMQGLKPLLGKIRKPV